MVVPNSLFLNFANLGDDCHFIRMEMQSVSTCKNHRCIITIRANHLWHHPTLHVDIRQSFRHALELVSYTFQSHSFNNMAAFPQEQVNETCVSCIHHNPPGISYGHPMSLTTRHTSSIDSYIIPHPHHKPLCQNKKSWMQSMIMKKNV